VVGQRDYAGKPVRGAGIIGLRLAEGHTYVCLVEKRNGRLGFPKGSMGYESVKVGALREWIEEAGLNVDRLALLQDAFVDDPKFGCRYLFAVCRTAAPGAGEPDESRENWAPPFEDQRDSDPIIRAPWVRVDRVLRREAPTGCHRALGSFGVHMLECALAENVARYLATVEAPEAIDEGSVARALALPGEFVADVLGHRWLARLRGPPPSRPLARWSERALLEALVSSHASVAGESRPCTS